VDQSYPAISLIVQADKGQNVFSLEGMQLPSFPAKMLDAPGIKLKVVRKDGSESDGVVRSFAPFPNGVEQPPYFDIPDMDKRHEFALSAADFNEGDVVQMIGLPPLFWVHLIDEVRNQLGSCGDLLERFDGLRSRFVSIFRSPEETDEAKQSAQLAFIEEAERAFGELGKRPDRPTLLLNQA
jgi:hypothetical protein